MSGLECVANADDEIGDLFLSEETISNELLMKAIRRATISMKFTPVLMGTALKNRGIQNLLDAVVHFLPNPSEAENHAFKESSK